MKALLCWCWVAAQPAVLVWTAVLAWALPWGTWRLAMAGLQVTGMWWLGRRVAALLTIRWWHRGVACVPALVITVWLWTMLVQGAGNDLLLFLAQAGSLPWQWPIVWSPSASWHGWPAYLWITAALWSAYACAPWIPAKQREPMV